jgi:hypothetical protein
MQHPGVEPDLCLKNFLPLQIKPRDDVHKKKTGFLMVRVSSYAKVSDVSSFYAASIFLDMEKEN